MSNKVKVIKPIDVTPAMVVETNLYDVAPTAYNSATAYSVGQYASVTGALGEILIYKSLQNSNLNHIPSSSPTWWVYSSSTYTQFNVNSVYSLGQKVYDSVTKYIYESLIDDNYSVLDKTRTPAWSSMGVSPITTVAPAWSSTTTYSAGQIVSVANTNIQQITIDYWVYKSLVNNNTNNYANPAYWEIQLNYPVPYNSLANFVTDKQVYTKDGSLWKSLTYYNRNNDPTTETDNWLKISPSNQTAMFDDVTATGSIANKELTVTVASGIIDSIGLIGVNADTAEITVRNGYPTGTVVFQKTIGLSGGNASNGWDYYFSDPNTRKKQAFIDGIPPYLNSYVTLKLTGVSSIGIGNLILGTSKELGIPENGLSSEILDYSKKDTDSFGRTTFIKRGFKRTLDLNMFVDNSNLARVESTLEDLRATPILVVASDVPEYSETAIRYCFYKTFRTEISYPTFAFCSIQFEGLI